MTAPSGQQPRQRIRVTWRPPERTPKPSSRDPLVAARHRTLAAMRRARLGFWRTLGRSNRLFPRKLVVTREGKWIIGVALLLGAAAVNTGNNLLYLVLSLLISVISVSGMLSEMCLRDLEVQRHYPTEVEVDAVAPLRLEVHNDKRRSALHIEVGEVADATDELQVRDGYLLHLPAGETGQAFGAVRPLRRGPVATVGLHVSTSYPFGFAKKSRLFEDTYVFLALPPVAEVVLPAVGAMDRGAHNVAQRIGHGDDFAGLRDARTGDALRDVHWKASARRGRPIVREWQAEAARVALVRFVHVAPTADPHPRTLDRACATVAGICQALLQRGWAVALQTFEGGVAAAAEQPAGGEQLLRIRRHLAQLTPADRPPPADWPLDDHGWAQAHRTATARAAQAERGEPLAWGPLALPGQAEVFEVAFATRNDIRTIGNADVHIALQADGTMAHAVRADRDRGAA